MSASDAVRKEVQTQPIEGFRIAGLSIVTSNADGGAAPDINALWQKFIDEDWLHRIEDRIDNVIYAAYHDYQGDETKPFRVTLGCRLKDDAGVGELASVSVPAADYVIFAARGEQPKALLHVWETVWKSDLPRSFATDIEIYGPRFFEPGLHEVLVCIGVNNVPAH